MTLKGTATGKTIKTGLWIVGGYAVATVTARLAGYHWSASLVALGVPSIVNLILYSASQFFDSAVPNFPSSTPPAPTPPVETPPPAPAV